jgi:predicted NACHT family NTPase
MAPAVIDKALDDVYETVFKAAGRSVSKWVASLDVFQAARQRYFDSLKIQHGQVRILGMPKPLPLETLYVRVRIIENVRNRRYLDEQYLSYLSKKKDVPWAIMKELNRFLEDEAIDGIETIEQTKRVILHGGPGSGKTTYLRYLALFYANLLKTRPQAGRWLFPILVTLRDLNTKGNSLQELIREQLSYARIPDPQPFYQRLLDQGRVILLLDGLDEAASGKHAAFVRQLKQVVAAYPKSIAVVSSRAIDTLAQLENFTELQIVEFSDLEISTFVSNWFSKADQGRGKDLIHKIATDIHLQELATTPLLLSLLCILYRNDLQIPKNRSELYTRCIECLLREWDASRGFRRETAFERLSDARKMQLFAKIASYFFKRDELFFREAELNAQISEFLADLDIEEPSIGAVLDEIESHHGIIARRSRNVYSFSHLTYQEYFVARHVAEEGNQEELARRVADPRWHEIIGLVAASLNECSVLILAVLSNIDHRKLDLLAKKGKLGHEYNVLKSLVQSELRMRRSLRQQLYDAFLRQHQRVYSIPWESLMLEWRFSPKPNRIMVNLGFSKMPSANLRVTHAVAGFRHTLDIAAISESFLRHFSTAARPAEEALQEQFDKFVALCEAVQKRAVGYRLKLI